MAVDEAGRRPTVAEVRAVGQPPEVLARRSEEHWTGTLYMRRISPFFTWLALRAGLSANSVTVIMIMVGIVGVAVATLPGVAPAVAALIAIQLYLLLDCVDGEVARFNATTGARGVYLDRLGHYLVEGGLMVAVGIRASGGDETWVIVGMAAAIGVLLEKAETDLVPASRLRSGFGPAPAEADEITGSGLARVRSMARLAPIHMVTHAAEATLLILAAAIADEIAESMRFGRALAVTMLSITSVVVVLHLVSIWRSRRLDQNP